MKFCNPAGDMLDAVGTAHRSTTVFLDDQCHVVSVKKNGIP
jgi:hypothetical protein